MLRKTMRFACVVGARPNFIKMASLMAEIDRRSLPRVLIHTGQHSSPAMSDSFFRELELPKPDVNLEVGPGTQIDQLAEMMKRIEPALLDARPDVVMVVGDVNSTLAAALAAVKLRIPIAHVEAGLRSFDRTMPEEVNRVVVDVISDYLFVTERSGLANLSKEGVATEKVHFVGNVMIDTLLQFRHKAQDSKILARLGLQSGAYCVATLHRPANVDDPARLRRLMGVLEKVSTRLPVVFPMHPRTRKRLNGSESVNGQVIWTEPLGYLDFLCLMSGARLVLTDSGGIQEETTILQVPCLVLRENTERPVTIEQGTNRLVGVDPKQILLAVEETLTESMGGGKTPELWDGHASKRILDVLQRGRLDRSGQMVNESRPLHSLQV